MKNHSVLSRIDKRTGEKVCIFIYQLLIISQILELIDECFIHSFGGIVVCQSSAGRNIGLPNTIGCQQNVEINIL